MYKSGFGTVERHNIKQYYQINIRNLIRYKFIYVMQFNKMF